MWSLKMLAHFLSWIFLDVVPIWAAMSFLRSPTVSWGEHLTRTASIREEGRERRVGEWVEERHQSMTSRRRTQRPPEYTPLRPSLSFAMTSIMDPPTALKGSEKERMSAEFSLRSPKRRRALREPSSTHLGGGAAAASTGAAPEEAADDPVGADGAAGGGDLDRLADEDVEGPSLRSWGGRPYDDPRSP